MITIRILRVILLLLSVLLIAYVWDEMFVNKIPIGPTVILLWVMECCVLLCNAVLLQINNLPDKLLLIPPTVNVLYVIVAQLDYYHWDLESQAYLEWPMFVLVYIHALLALILFARLWRRIPIDQLKGTEVSNSNSGG
jgi:hypothetical protein